MSNQLLPCPFCGGKADIESDDTDYPNHEAVCQDCGARCHVTGCGPEDGWEWNRRATQPAAGEPEQQTAINADDLPTKKYPIGAFDFDAPVAAGEPVAWMKFDGSRVLTSDVKEKAEQRTLEGKEECAFYNIPLYAAPPAAAHGDEAVRRDAQAAYLEMTCQPVMIDGATHYYLSSDRIQDFDRLFSVDFSDAAMRAQGDGGEA